MKLWQSKFRARALLFVSLQTITLVNASVGFSKVAISYDEVYDESHRVRPHYEQAVNILSHYTRSQIEMMQAASYHDFGGDNILFPLPRILTQQELSTLRAGVEQRGRALRAFLTDHYSGQKLYQNSNLFPQKRLERILTRYREHNLDSWLRPESVSFWYGPDIIRGPDGEFYVVEDNLGYLGGMGDLLIAKDILLKRCPDFSQLAASSDPMSYYRTLVESYQQRSVDGGKVIHVSYHQSLAADKEDVRTSKIFAHLGIPTVLLASKNGSRKGPRLVSKADGIYFVASPGAEEEKVGLIIADGEADDFDAQMKVYRNSRRQPRTAKLKNAVREQADFPGLYSHYLAGHLEVVNGPGFDFLGDKEFYMYVEGLIDFYLGETPILHSIPSRSFYSGDSLGARRAKAKVELLNEVFHSGPEAKDNYVIKKVDGRGGDAVWVGPKISEQEFAALEAKIKAEPGAYLVQEYLPLSQIDGRIVDLRIHADVSSDSVIVSPIPWSRGVDAGGNGKVNLSDQGGELVVLVFPSQEQGLLLGQQASEISYVHRQALYRQARHIKKKHKRSRAMAESDQDVDGSQGGYVVKYVRTDEG